MSSSFHVQSLALVLCTFAVTTSVSQMSSSFKPDPSRFMIYNYEDGQVASYNPNEQRCCLGNLKAKESNSYRRCCGAEDYDSTTEACCDGTIAPKQVGFECCDKTYFNVSEGLCCRSGLRPQLIEFPASIRDSAVTRRNTQCCGGQLYDTRIKLCCRLPSPRGSTFRVVDKVYTNTVCCKGKAFDATSGLCNDNVFQIQPFPYPGFSGSSVSFAIRPFPPPPNPMRPMPRPSPVFQDFQPVPQPEFGFRAMTVQSPSFLVSMNKCNGKQFNPATHLCCGIYQPNNVNPESGLAIRSRTTVTTVCCGDETFDFTKQMCCNGESRAIDFQNPKVCCGTELYDPTTQWCCDEPSGAIATAQPLEGDYCCGSAGTVFSYDKQICCGGRLLDLPEGIDPMSVSCCTGSNGETPQIFNVTTQRCCEGAVVDLPAGTVADRSQHLHCCGKTLINYRRSQCCNLEPLLRLGNQSCCRGNEVYNPNTHLCCNTVVEKTSPRNRLCCGDKAFNPEKETCCANPANGETTVSATNRTFRLQACCLGVSYDPTQQICCNGDLLPKSDLCCTTFNDDGNIEFNPVEKKSRNGRCCGLTEYDPDTQRCCKNTPISLEKDKRFCCGIAAYNSQTHMCCGEELFERGGENPVNACCGTNGYNTTMSICCGGYIKDRVVGQPTGCCYPHQIDWS